MHRTRGPNAAKIARMTISVITFDLDNTLWDGILSDDGINGIKIGQEKSGFVFYRFQLFLLELKNIYFGTI